MRAEINKYFAFLKKDLLSTISYKYSFFTGILFGLFSLIVTFAMASVFKAAIIPSAIPYGGDYLAFLITGAVIWQVVTFGLYSISSSIMVEMVAGTLEMIYVSRANILLSILGVSLFSLLRNTLLAVLTILLASAIFGIQFHFENLFLALIILLLTYTSMLGFGMAIGGITMVTKSSGRIVSILTLLMAVLSGVVIPVSLLPEWARHLSSVVPITYALDGLRNVLLLGSGFEKVQEAILLLALISLIVLPLGYLAFLTCQKIARKQGSLGQF
jgi:ABC-2 type transport system permease protein